MIESQIMNRRARVVGRLSGHDSNVRGIRINTVLTIDSSLPSTKGVTCGVIATCFFFSRSDPQQQFPFCQNDI